MIATIGFILAIGLLVYMIIRGIDMITATVVTAAVILVTSGLNVWDGFLTTYSGGIGSFVTSWFLILGLGGVFGQLVLEAGLATRIAKTLTEKLGAKMVGAVILICSFFITLLGINGYIMVFVLYPIADNLLKQNKMDRRVLPFLILGGGACANGFAFSLDVCNVLPSNYLDTSLGSSRFCLSCLQPLRPSAILYISIMRRSRAEKNTAWKNCWPCIRKMRRKRMRWSCQDLAFLSFRSLWCWERLL